jgi:hypothetical protein
MISQAWTRKGLVLSVAIVTLAALAAVSIAFAYPEPVSSAALGSDWQCTRLAFVLTSCTRIVSAPPKSISAWKDPACQRGTVLAQSGPGRR